MAVIERKDLRIDIYNHAVPGSTYHARVTHIPTGKVATAEHKSQTVAVRNATRELERVAMTNRQVSEGMMVTLGETDRSGAVTFQNREFWQIKKAIAKLEDKIEEARTEQNRLYGIGQGLVAELALFPMQDGPPLTRKTAEMVYEMYSNLYGTDQSLDRMAERGGFGWSEIDVMRKELNRRRGRDVYAKMRKAWNQR